MLVTKSKNLLLQVMNYSNESVVKRISKEVNCTYQEASEIFEDTKRFLYLCGVYGGGFAPALKIDDGWHAFILHTKDYLDFCINFFERFIHHYPNGDNYDKEKGLKEIEHTLEVARLVFGQLSSNWNYSKNKQSILLEVDLRCSDTGCNSCSDTSSCRD